MGFEASLIRYNVKLDNEPDLDDRRYAPPTLDMAKANVEIVFKPVTGELWNMCSECQRTAKNNTNQENRRQMYVLPVYLLSRMTL